MDVYVLLACTHWFVHTLLMKVNVSMSFQPSDLERLDAWASERRLTRSAAVMVLLDGVGQPLLSPPPMAPGVTSFEKNDDWGFEDLAEAPPRVLTHEEMIASGQLKLAPQPGERRVVYEDGRKR